MSNVKSQIFELYKSNIKSGYCSTCKKYANSKKETKVGPQSIFHIGKNKDEKHVVFVGKNSWNSTEYLISEDKIGELIDTSEFGKEAYIDDENYNSAYWKYIRFITKKSGLSLENISITNLAKCNIYDHKTNTYQNISDDFYFECCIEIFEKEIELLEPTHIICFTGAGYDHLIKKLTFGFDEPEIKDDMPFDENHKKNIKKKDGTTNKVWWWQRQYSNGDNKIHLLRTRHPQGAPSGLKDDIVKWINDTAK